MSALFVTRGGVKVRAIGRPRRVDGTKPGWAIPCVRVDTQGYHGMLRVERLSPRNDNGRRVISRCEARP